MIDVIRGSELVEGTLEERAEKQWSRVGLDGGERVWARHALAEPLGVGDRVLVAGGAEGHYLIGLLEAAPGPRSVTSGEGASAFVERDAEGERVGVRDAAGALLFEYRPGSGRATLRSPEGDLVLAAPRGAVDLRGAAGIRIASAGEVAVCAPGIRTESERFEVECETARLRARWLQVGAEVASGIVGQARWVVGRLEIAAERIVERARSVHRRVEGACELVAQRLRTVVERGYRVEAGRADLRAKGRMRIDGERIDLG